MLTFLILPQEISSASQQDPVFCNQERQWGLLHDRANFLHDLPPSPWLWWFPKNNANFRSHERIMHCCKNMMELSVLTVTHNFTAWRFCYLNVFWPMRKVMHIKRKSILNRNVKNEQMKTETFQIISIKQNIVIWKLLFYFLSH